MADANSEHIKVSYEDVHLAVVNACDTVIKDSYKPDILIGISTGGLVVVKIVKACLEDYFKKEKIPTYVIGISYYDKNKNRMPEPIITQQLDSDLEKKIEGAKVLICDEVDDSRATLEKASDYILGLRARELRILVAHMKDMPKDGRIPENVKFYYGKKMPPNWIYYQWGFRELFLIKKNSGI